MNGKGEGLGWMGKLPVVNLQIEAFITIRESQVLGQWAQNFTLTLWAWQGVWPKL